MHPADIKAALQKKGYTQTQVAAMALRRHGHAHKSAVSRVIAGDLKSEGLAKLISQLIGVSPSQIWPGKYPGLAYLEKAGLMHTSAAKAKADLQRTPISQRSAGKKKVSA